MTARLGIPVPGRAPGEQAVAFAAELIDRSGKAPVIEAALAHRTGRHRPLPVRAVLTALLCLALDDRPLFLTEVTRLLFCQLPPASRRLTRRARRRRHRAGLPERLPPVRYCFHAILSVADPSPLPKNRRLTRQNLQARTKPMTPGQATAARGRLEALVNALLEASVSVLTGDERAALGGGTGLDATPVPLFSRGPSRRTGLSASDPDGGWYVREGDHREREDDKGKPLRKICWALEATIAATARPPGAPPGCPDLAIGMAMARPGEDPGGTGARVLTSPPPADTSPAGSATTAPTPRRSPSGSTCPPAPWATSPSWTTATTSSASRPTPAAPSSWKEPGTAPHCPSR